MHKRPTRRHESPPSRRKLNLQMGGPYRRPSAVALRRTRPHLPNLETKGELTMTKGGHFKVNIHLPTEYPFKPPVLNFSTKIYHPNVSNDEKGAMCLGMLRSDQWKPPNKIRAVLDMLRQLLIEPNIDDAVETGRPLLKVPVERI